MKSPDVSRPVFFFFRLKLWHPSRVFSFCFFLLSSQHSLCLQPVPPPHFLIHIRDDEHAADDGKLNDRLPPFAHLPVLFVHFSYLVSKCFSITDYLERELGGWADQCCMRCTKVGERWLKVKSTHGSFMRFVDDQFLCRSVG